MSQGAGRLLADIPISPSGPCCRASLGLAAFLPSGNLLDGVASFCVAVVRRHLAFTCLPALTKPLWPGVAIVPPSSSLHLPNLLGAWPSYPCLVARQSGAIRPAFGPWTALVAFSFATSDDGMPAGRVGKGREGCRAGPLGACPSHASLRFVACRLPVAGGELGPAACLSIVTMPSPSP